MRRRTLPVLLAALVATVAVSAALVDIGPTASDLLGPDQEYPEGAGPDYINFSALDADDNTVLYTPREYWDSYAIVYTEPPERRRVEGDYYIDSSTGEIIGDRWDGAKTYRTVGTYVHVQPADGIRYEHVREEYESDPEFVYDDATDAYYKYDPDYGSIAPEDIGGHNIGRHTDRLDLYAWEAVDTTTHHGVPVVTYRVTGKRNSGPSPPDTSHVLPPVDGTLQLGIEDGIVYAYDITLDGSEDDYRYTYAVRPAPFPDHGWVDTAREVAGPNATADSSS